MLLAINSDVTKSCIVTVKPMKLISRAHFFLLIACGLKGRAFGICELRMKCREKRGKDWNENSNRGRVNIKGK